MPDPNFTPPQADVRDAPKPKGSAIKGVLAGLAVDVGGTIAFSIVVSVAYGAMLAASGQGEEQIQAALAESDSNSIFSAIGVVGGCAFSILGGYVCERVARQRNYRAGAVLGVVSVVLGLAMGAASLPWAENMLLAFLTIGSVLLGTRLALERHAP
jgi:MFS family permease